MPKTIPGAVFVAGLRGKDPARFAALPGGRLLVAQADAPPAIMERAHLRYMEMTTPEQRAADWRAFKCGRCTLNCPTSPVCPDMED